MSINLKGIFRVIGFLMVIMSIVMIPSLLVAIIYGESTSTWSFLVTIIPSFIIGYLISKKFKVDNFKPKLRDGYLIVSLCWFIASIIGAVPFVLSGAIPNPVNAFFETCSGFSTTGSSILTDVEALPKAMLFWRSFTHWLGGMGILVFLMALLPTLGIGGQIIASAETPGPTLDKLTPRFSDTARNLYLVYLMFTVVETILLCLGGMNLYDSLIHTFGTVGTGGFSNYGASVGHFESPYIHWVITIFMALCGINFNLYFVFAKKGIRKMLEDPELKLYLGLIGATTLVIAINIYMEGFYKTGFESLTASAFQVSSIITTTGYATANFDLWPTFSKMVLFLIMLTGACSSSTGGGVKIIRILVALKLVKRGISRRIHPSRVVTVNLNGKALSTDTVTNIANFILIYIMVVFLGSLVVAIDGFDLITNITAVIVCVGNIGPGFNLVGPAMNFDLFSDFTTFILSLLMIAGRLEIFTVLMLFSPYYWDSNKA